jgi:hypothetical protein
MTFRSSGAGSTGRRNTGVKSLCWGFKLQGLKWSFVYPSIEAALKAAGFTSIRRCDMGDSGDPAFTAVEQHDRFYDEDTGIRELAVHCQRPV